MNCLEIQEHLLDYIDNELSGSYQQAVTEHLQSCLACREEAESYRKTAVLLQLRAVPEPAEAYWDATWEKIRAGFKARVLTLHDNKLASPSRWLWLKRFDWRHAAAVAAVFLLLAIAGLLAWRSQQPHELVTSAAPRTIYLPDTPRDESRRDEDFPEEIGRQMELISTTRVAFGSIDPISKSAMLVRMEASNR
jgi:anti-sigma factor RsiW